MTPALRDLIRWLAEDYLAEVSRTPATGSSTLPSANSHDHAGPNDRRDLRPLLDRQAERVVAR